MTNNLYTYISDTCTYSYFLLFSVDHDAFNNHQHTYSADTLHRGQSALCCKHRAKHSG